ncbi:MAG TPA: SRPBCC family protein [Jiangellaceae bacterium]|nr:SRPBCC family protein [Jiangellaceae bacterium]
MASFRHTIDIAATPEQVWQVLGDVTSVDRWIPGVTAVVRTDAGRVCTFDDGHTQVEQILDYSHETRSYCYVITGAPLPVSDNTGRFAVEDANGRALVVWESSFIALDPALESQLAQMWEPYMPLVLANLKMLVEHSATDASSMPREVEPNRAS